MGEQRVNQWSKLSVFDVVKHKTKHYFVSHFLLHITGGSDE